MVKQNCWEVLGCGREPGGACADELGVCPAAADTSVDGVNGGVNGGRVCWTIADTFCGGAVQGSGARKRLTCLHCEFFDRVQREEAASLSLPTRVSDGSIRGLILLALGSAAVWGFVAAVGFFLSPASMPTPIAVMATAVAAISLLGAYYFRAATRWETVVLGYGFAALQVLTLSVAEFASLSPWSLSLQVSWGCVLLLIMPLVLATSPRTTVRGSLAAASMGAVGYGVAVAVGVPPVTDIMVLGSRLLPLFVCALIASLPARAIHRLARDVKRAQRLGSYELVTRLGAGGMGEVWRARHRMLARPAAVKLIRPNGGNTMRMLERFEREAQATATLESPHTVQLYDFGVSDDGAFYYVMEYLRGVDMNVLVSRFGPQPSERVAHFLRQACDSLEDAHRIGLVHRDVKPANLFVTTRGRRTDFVKVLDFGLVRLGTDKTDLRATADGHVVGTPAFMAPEAVLGERMIDGRADVYALGCVAYWLLTGRTVFLADAPMAMALAHATAEPKPPSHRTEMPVPAALDDLVMACLAKTPDERPDAACLGAMLEATGLEDRWSDERARAWWAKHAPSGIFNDEVLAADVHRTGVLVPA